MNQEQVRRYFTTGLDIPKLRLIEYTNKRLEFFFPFTPQAGDRWYLRGYENQAMRSHYIFDLEGDTTVQSYRFFHGHGSWEEVSMRELIARNIFPLTTGINKDGIGFQEYIYEDKNNIRQRIRTPIQEKYYPLKQANICLCQETQMHHPTITLNSFHKLRFFENLRAGDFDVLGVAFDAWMALQDLPYLDTDTPYSLSSITGTIRSLREQHQYHLAYGLALKVRQEERESALALAHPVLLYQDVPLRAMGKHKA